MRSDPTLLSHLSVACTCDLSCSCGRDQQVMTKGEGGIVYRPLNWELHQLRLQRDRPVHITVGAAPIHLLSSSSILFFRLHFHHLSVKWLNGTIFLSLRGIYYPAQFHSFLCLRLRYTKSTWVHLECFFFTQMTLTLQSPCLQYAHITAHKGSTSNPIQLCPIRTIHPC